MGGREKGMSVILYSTRYISMANAPRASDDRERQGRG